MDGLDLSAIDQIDQDVFNVSSDNSNTEEASELPLPDCIGIDSAVQDDEQVRLKQNENFVKNIKTRSQIERELELNILKPDSIRRQILEQSLKEGNNKVGQADKMNSREPLKAEKGAHVMNIIEKAGMSGIDKEKINEIIHEASKGSLFYKKQAQRQEEIHNSIEKMLNKVKMATPSQVNNAKITCDKLLKDLEKQRSFNRVIAHFDLDMFFAAVEIRDNPELADQPIAVGGDSMVSTSNYIARRYGVRAAMPGFIARKLCPDLLLIKPNGMKYRQASSEVFSVLEEYDAELTSMSLDEAYLDLTDYVKNTLERDGLEIQEYYDGTLPKIWWTRASEVVKEIREAIYAKTKLTCSAGIACNTLLAKISTDINKPDGQFMVEGYPQDILDFIKKTPVGKVSGIGKVSGQFLNALDIKTCGDIYEKRHFLPLVFYEINVRFYLRVALGDGSTCIKSDEQRKSKSVERTFSTVKDSLILLDKLDGICEELCAKYLRPYRIRGRTITLKLKRNTFTTTTKSYSLLVPTNDKLVIYSASKNLLLAEIANEPPQIGYRLLGVKLSNLADEGVTTNQLTIDAMLRNQVDMPTKSEATVHRVEQNRPESSSNENDDVSPSDLLSIREESLQKLDDVSSHGVAKTPIIQSDDSQDVVVLGGVKRKAPASKRIDDYFAGNHKQPKRQDDIQVFPSTHFNNPDNVVKIVNEDDEDDQSGGDTFTEPNDMSQRERRENEPNDEDFQCPCCFKPFSDFTILETHASQCFLKTSIDVHKTFFIQRAPIKDELGAHRSGSTSQPESRKKVGGSQPIASKKGRKPIKSNSGASTPRSTTQIPSTQNGSAQSGSTPKMSFYQKFVESNSQSLSKSPKVEPLQCPYCMHGFLEFKLLENHVIMCPKKK